MNTEDYVSFEIANLLKEKGFNEKVKAFYSYDSEFKICDFQEDDRWDTPNDWGEYYWSAPTIQMAMKWLREVHNYAISICLDSYVEPYDNQYYIVVRRRKDKYENISPCEQVYFDTYEEACEAGIKYCLENLI